MSIRTGAIAAPRLGRLVPFALIAAGLAALTLMGFAQGDILHELAHDGRHMLAFPCH